MSARILVVDDILPNVKLLEAKLKAEYYEVLTATSGQEALDIAEKEKPDVVLLDIMMPGMDGFEVCERLKANPATVHIPVIMVTALTDATDRVRGLEAGADDFLSKPVNDTALMARVRSLVRLKMIVDEWQIRETAANQLGAMGSDKTMMAESAENAHVLVLEDNSMEMSKIVETMQRDSAKTVSVTMGEQAIEESQFKDFDLIIVSLNMVNEDGLRLCSFFRSNERSRAVPILMIGEEQDMQRIARGLEIGANDYILRPLDRNELLARVRTQVRRKRYQDRLRTNYELSLSMALTDELTGLYNRRYLMVHLEKILAKHEIDKKPVGVLMMDIDHFKPFNDTYGHDIGDLVLKIFAERVNKGLRGLDMVARMGGEEFVAILPNATTEIAIMVAERLRRMVGDTPFPCDQVEAGELTVTMSIGGFVLTESGYDTNRALKAADDALYEAKEAGRNCSFFHGLGKIDPANIPQRKIRDDSEDAGVDAEAEQQEAAAAEPVPAPPPPLPEQQQQPQQPEPVSRPPSGDPLDDGGDFFDLDEPQKPSGGPRPNPDPFEKPDTEPEQNAAPQPQTQTQPQQPQSPPQQQPQPQQTQSAPPPQPAPQTPQPPPPQSQPAQTQEPTQQQPSQQPQQPAPQVQPQQPPAPQQPEPVSRPPSGDPLDDSSDFFDLDEPPKPSPSSGARPNPDPFDKPETGGDDIPEPVPAPPPPYPAKDAPFPPEPPQDRNKDEEEDENKTGNAAGSGTPL